MYYPLTSLDSLHSEPASGTIGLAPTLKICDKALACNPQPDRSHGKS